MNSLTFSESPAVELGTNLFRDVPVVLQYDDTPLIEVVRLVDAGYDIQIPIFHTDGTYLAKVKGTQLHLTEAGKKCGLSLRHPDKQTVCELDGRTLFEIRRDGAAAVRAYAELSTPVGAFVKINDNPRPDLVRAGADLCVGGVVMSGNSFNGCPIGVWVGSDGSWAIGGRPTVSQSS